VQLVSLRRELNGWIPRLLFSHHIDVLGAAWNEADSITRKLERALRLEA
jgi:hypothetical protein